VLCEDRGTLHPPSPASLSQLGKALLPYLAIAIRHDAAPSRVGDDRFGCLGVSASISAPTSLIDFQVRPVVAMEKLLVVHRGRG
jgi:hypothetical protein